MLFWFCFTKAFIFALILYFVMYFSLGSIVNWRALELLFGAVFVYVGYLKFTEIGLDFVMSFPLLIVNALIFFAIGVLMVLSRSHIAVVGLVLVALGISLHGLGFFESYSVSYLFYRFGIQPVMFLTDFLMPMLAVVWVWKGGSY
ncbi:MAG: hypothetical protein DRN71_00260 [Candidatus Nanohalarchaeota archaeon]|nr:MAG: hypothetical protein DRN71_00260 [Candidatus Nanohaloarchaeota archaeon]